MKAKVVRRVRSRQPIALSECAQKYAIAISAPWDPRAEGACIPRHPSRPSQKVKTFARFTMTIGTGGVGFVHVIPSLAANAVNAVYTSSTYAGTTIGGVSTATTGISTYGNNSPYQLTAFSASGSGAPNIQGRVVSVGMSIQYTGTKLNEGGLYYMLVDPNHQNCNRFTSLADIGAFAEALTIRVDDSKQWLLTSSIENKELEYYNSNTNAAITALDAVFPYSQGIEFSGPDTTLGGSPMMVAVTGTAGNTFQVEIVQHVEFVGYGCQAAVTPTHGDSRGFELVAAASARLPALRASNPRQSPLALMGSAVRDVALSLSPAAPQIGGAIGGYLGSFVGQASLGASLGMSLGRNLALRR